MMKSPRRPQVASSHPAELIVFDKSPASTAALFSQLSSPESRAIAKAWLVEARTPYLIVGSMGGANPKLLTLGAYDEEDLLASALPEAMGLLAREAIAGSHCAAVDAALHAKVSERWEALKALRIMH